MAVFVVVGAGVAGCAAAAAIAEHESHHVIVCEAGGPTGITSGCSVELTADSDRFRYRFGRGLGGSSSINGAMVTVDDALLSRMRVPLEEAALGPIGELLLAAEPSAAPVMLMTSGGERRTAYDIFLDGRERVEVRVNTPVERIELAGSRAMGVVTSGGERIRADHVVVCAGAIASPLLLLRSGCADPRIGHGLTDHPALAFALPAPRSERLYPSVRATLRRGAAVGELVAIETLGDGQASGALMAALLNPRSRGRVSLDGDEPVVEFNQLADPLDGEALAAFARRAAEILDWADEIPHDLGGYFHAAGSCSLATDRAGGVYQNERITVADAASLRRLPISNMMLTVADHARRIGVALASGAD